MRSAKLPLVAIANVAGNFTLPSSTNFALAVPRRLAVPEILGSGWYSLAVGSSGIALCAYHTCICCQMLTNALSG